MLHKKVHELDMMKIKLIIHTTQDAWKFYLNSKAPEEKCGYNWNCVILFNSLSPGKSEYDFENVILSLVLLIGIFRW